MNIVDRHHHRSATLIHCNPRTIHSRPESELHQLIRPRLPVSVILLAQGYGFVLLARGRAAGAIADRASARRNGVVDAREAAHAAKSEGFADGGIVFLDVEEGGRLPAAFIDLERNEPKQNFRIRSRVVKSITAIIAPHGGGIEPGTSEIAEAIAGTEFSFYAFEGLMPRGNSRLHITSTHFDDPNCVEILSRADQVVAIHGENSASENVFLGGLDVDCVGRVNDFLKAEGFCVGAHGNVNLQGRNYLNICNRGKLRAGVQIELSPGFY